MAIYLSTCTLYIVFIYLFIYLSIYLHVYKLYIYIIIYIYIQHVYIYIVLYIIIYLHFVSIYMYLQCISVCLSSIYLHVFIYLIVSIYLSIYTYIYLFLHVFTQADEYSSWMAGCRMAMKGRPLVKQGYEQELSSIKAFVSMQDKSDTSHTTSEHVRIIINSNFI